MNSCGTAVVNSSIDHSKQWSVYPQTMTYTSHSFNGYNSFGETCSSNLTFSPSMPTNSYQSIHNFCDPMVSSSTADHKVENMDVETLIKGMTSVSDDAWSNASSTSPDTLTSNEKIRCGSHVLQKSNSILHQRLTEPATRMNSPQWQNHQQNYDPEQQMSSKLLLHDQFRSDSQYYQPYYQSMGCQSQYPIQKSQQYGQRGQYQFQQYNQPMPSQCVENYSMPMTSNYQAMKQPGAELRVNGMVSPVYSASGCSPILSMPASSTTSSWASNPFDGIDLANSFTKAVPPRRKRPNQANKTKSLCTSKAEKDKRGYPCPKCNKIFRNKSNIKTHIRIHTGEKPFVCDICRRPFSQKAHLKKHASNVHKPKE